MNVFRALFFQSGLTTDPLSFFWTRQKIDYQPDQKMRSQVRGQLRYKIKEKKLNFSNRTLLSFCSRVSQDITLERIQQHFQINVTTGDLKSRKEVFPSQRVPALIMQNDQIAWES